MASSRLVCVVLTLGAILPTPARAGSRRPDPGQVIPLNQVDAARRAEVAEVIRDNHFHRQGSPETFPCHPRIYASLLNEPALTLALWQDLSSTPARLKQVDVNRYQGTDGSGTTATWEFVLRSPRLNVLICDLDYVGPRGNVRLEGRIVLVIRTDYLREPGGDPWVKHDLEAFVKIDSRGWKAVAVTVRPLIEKLLQEQVEEAGWFVSLMGRLVTAYPDWATAVCLKQTSIRPEVRAAFRDVVTQTRKPGAFTGRPVLADQAEMATVKAR